MAAMTNALITKSLVDIRTTLLKRAKLCLMINGTPASERGGVGDRPVLTSPCTRPPPFVAGGGYIQG